VNRRPDACYNSGMRECPLCGESMRLSVREVQEKDGAIRQVREWICPECDYFEDADMEG
jgi:transposase